MSAKLFSLIAVVLFIAACTPPEKPPQPPESGLLTKEACEKGGGRWNECGSPCAGTGAEMCVMMCEAMCECGGIAGWKCPEGYMCRLSGKVADEIGKCVAAHSRN